MKPNGKPYDTRTARLRGLASRAGVTTAEYLTHRANGRLYCDGCATWHPERAFAPARGERGRRRTCKVFAEAIEREAYR